MGALKAPIGAGALPREPIHGLKCFYQRWSRVCCGAGFMKRFHRHRLHVLCRRIRCISCFMKPAPGGRGLGRGFEKRGFRRTQVAPPGCGPVFCSRMLFDSATQCNDGCSPLTRVRLRNYIDWPLLSVDITLPAYRVAQSNYQVHRGSCTSESLLYRLICRLKPCRLEPNQNSPWRRRLYPDGQRLPL